ncbi:reverse transcriptase [Cucumis melo var. makuwa]|uniref:Reverse transcriptase n=1 Tax=Cucumis melo var. makuwa TaxID=1194695 RepID=A0A5A7TFU4_CUCMM|nr:reverse transcriptase [Cucumis melo var. makuwa]TYK18026.1 reverse transcriptase [Cucumis melo var. makuwa]
MDLCRETVWDTPNDGTQYTKLEEIDRVYDFLAGLNSKFDIVCGRILGQRPLPSLMEVCFEVYLEEDRTNAMIVTRIMGSQFLCVSTARNNGTPRISVGNSTVVSQEVRNGPPRRNITQDVPTLVRLPLPALLNQLILLRAKPRLQLWVELLSQDMSSGRTIGTAQYSRGLYILDDDTSCSSLSRISLLSSYFSTSEQDSQQHRIAFSSQSYKPTQPFILIHSDVWGPSKVTTSSGKRWFVTFIDDHTFLTWVYLITDKSKTLLDCLKESYPSTSLISEVPLRVFGCTVYVHNFGSNQSKFTSRAQTCVFVGYPLHQCGYKYFHPPSRKYFVTMDVTFCENRPYFPVSHLQGESVSEESNSTFEFIEPTPNTVSDVDTHPIILPTNQVPWKTYYRRNLRKEVGSPTSQPSTPA